MVLQNKFSTLIFFILFLQYSSNLFAQKKLEVDSLTTHNQVKKVQTSNQILINFLSNTKTLKADFTHEQTDSNGKIITFFGQMVFRRPDRLRWDVKKPYPQLQLLRGKEFLLYDPDLNQVTVREVDDSLFDSPAGLLFSSGPGAKKLLEERYSLISAPDKDNMKWVLARPKKLSDENPTIELGVNSNGHLTELISIDVFGRSSRIRLKNISWNKVVKDFVFVPVIPSGVEYLKQ